MKHSVLKMNINIELMFIFQPTLTKSIPQSKKRSHHYIIYQFYFSYEASNAVDGEENVYL